MTGKQLGRPSSYSDAVAQEICVQLASGKPLTEICRKEGMPGLTTVYKWLNDFKDFAKMYTRAREEQADTLAAEIMEIADDSRNDFIQNADGETVLDREHLERSKLRIEARKWIAAKLKPHKYGEMQRVQLEGEIKHRVIPADITPEQAERDYLAMVESRKLQ